jgi:hypothetical protein
VVLLLARTDSAVCGWGEVVAGRWLVSDGGVAADLGVRRRWAGVGVGVPELTAPDSGVLEVQPVEESSDLVAATGLCRDIRVAVGRDEGADLVGGVVGR